MRYMRVFAGLLRSGASNDSEILENGTFRRFRRLLLRKLWRLATLSIAVQKLSSVCFSDTKVGLFKL